MVRSKFFGVLVICLLGHMGSAQADRYMVFFSDKENVAFSTDNPEGFLSDRSISRRERMGIAVTDADLPVDIQYVQEVKATGAEVYFTSRWFNAALTQMTEAQLSAVSALAFVDSVKYIAKGERLSHTQSDYTIPENFKIPDRISANTTTQLALLGVDEMHKDGYRGEEIIIAVFDDGFLGVNEYAPFEHIFEEERLLGTRDFIANSGNVFQYDDHGTAVFSCIAAAYGDNVSGTAPKASYLLCVTEDLQSEYRVEEYNWLLAAEYADSAGADIINGSLGYSTFSDNTMNYSYDDLDGKTAIVTMAATMATERGMLVVVSAGNEGNGSWGYITSPADAANILAVGSVSPDGIKSGFSSVGPTPDGRVKPDVVAMGSFTSIFYVSGNEGVISTGNGTSFAAPQIAGFAAGIWQANPDWSNIQVMNAIRQSGNRSHSPDSLYGYGIPHYPVVMTVGLSDTTFKVYPNPFRENVINIHFGDMVLENRLRIQLYDLMGKELYSDEMQANTIPRKLEIEVNGLVSGNYILLLTTKGFKKSVQLRKI